jgi:hypothetical protein
MTPPMSNPSPSPAALPPRPQRRPCAPRGATVCFWAVLVLFVAGLVYIGLRAFSAKTASLQSTTSVFDGHLLFGCILACCTIAGIAGCIATRSHRHHPHH